MAALLLTGCKSDLDGHWVGEACGEGSGFEMEFRTELVQGGKGRDRIWAGTGTLVQDCMGSDAYGWTVRDGTTACEWTYAVAMRHHPEDNFVGRIFFGFGECVVPADPDSTPDDCPFYLWYTVQNDDELRTNLAMGFEHVDGALGHRDCGLDLTRVDAGK